MTHPPIDNIKIHFNVVNPNDIKNHKFPNDKNTLFIIKNVEKHTGVACKDFFSTSRKRHTTLPRQICMYFLHKYSHHKTVEIASFFKSESQYKKKFKSHTTVLHANKVVSDLIETDKFIEAICDSINQDIVLFQNRILQSVGSTKIDLFTSVIRKYIDDEDEIQLLLSEFINSK